MRRQYMTSMFFLCFFVWAILVDNAILPNMDHLNQDAGSYTRYRVKKWDQLGNLDLLKDELLVYAIVKNREQLYYMEYTPNFAATLDSLQEGAPVQLGYVHRFPKFWKRQLYDLRIDGHSALRFSPYALIQKQKENWKITGIMGGIFVFLALLGLISKPRSG